jgi:hypothetical protein
MPGYPADAVPGASTGAVTLGAAGAEPYYPAGGVSVPGAVGPGEEIPPASFPDSAPGTYRPGQQP